MTKLEVTYKLTPNGIRGTIRLATPGVLERTSIFTSSGKLDILQGTRQTVSFVNKDIDSLQERLGSVVSHIRSIIEDIRLPILPENEIIEI